MDIDLTDFGNRINPFREKLRQKKKLQDKNKKEEENIFSIKQGSDLLIEFIENLYEDANIVGSYIARPKKKYNCPFIIVLEVINKDRNLPKNYKGVHVVQTVIDPDCFDNNEIEYQEIFPREENIENEFAVSFEDTFDVSKIPSHPSVY